MKERTKVIVDDTTIYEVDLACYESLTPEEKRKYFPQAWAVIAAASFGFSLSSAAAEAITDSVDSAAAAN